MTGSLNNPDLPLPSLPANAEEEVRGVKASEYTHDTLTKEQIGTEHGGRTLPLDPARYGDWEAKGKCVDF